jgi:hypothetical protein
LKNALFNCAESYTIDWFIKKIMKHWSQISQRFFLSILSPIFFLLNYFETTLPNSSWHYFSSCSIVIYLSKKLYRFWIIFKLYWISTLIHFQIWVLIQKNNQSISCPSINKFILILLIYIFPNNSILYMIAIVCKLFPLLIVYSLPLAIIDTFFRHKQEWVNIWVGSILNRLLVHHTFYKFAFQ